ncbi:hypothetical protein AALA82_02040 [Oscillospiraceae bacterium 50-16]
MLQYIQLSPKSQGSCGLARGWAGVPDRRGAVTEKNDKRADIYNRNLWILDANRDNHAEKMQETAAGLGRTAKTLKILLAFLVKIAYNIPVFLEAVQALCHRGDTPL